MRRILFLSAIAILSLLPFLGCDDENKILSNENDKCAATDSIPAADSVKISIVLNCDTLSLYVGEFDTLIAKAKNGDNLVDSKFTWSTDNSSIAVVDSNGVVTALSVGKTVITVTYQGVNYTCMVVVTERPIVYEYVDLGLSVKWATCNVGATKPEEYGDYYAWGETEPKSTYDWSTYKWCNGSYNTLTKYCSDSECGNDGFTDTKITLDLEDDVAHVKWGGNWRMPTKAEQEELRTNCTWTWYDSDNTEFGGVPGCKVTSNMDGYTDCFIFLPAAGCRYDTYLSSVGAEGYCWSSSFITGEPYRAWYVGFYSGHVYANYGRRRTGRPVRPVCPSEEWLSSVSISFVEDSVMMLVGGSAMLNVTVKQNDEICNNPPIIWTSDNPSVVVVNENGIVTALSAGTASIIVSIQCVSAQCTITVTDDESKVIHEFVDLGLSVKWGTFNVGATKPEDFGGYYAWGETEPKIDYSWETYMWCDGSYNTLTKYCNKSGYGNNGFTDTKTTLELEDDVAHVKWGGNWRMPTNAEQYELRYNCTWTWYGSGNTEFGGVPGYKVTSNMDGYTNRFIFLPAAGCRSGTDLINVGTYGYFWSSSLITGTPDLACTIYFYYRGVSSYNGNRSTYGSSVRPVCE